MACVDAIITQMCQIFHFTPGRDELLEKAIEMILE